MPRCYVCGQDREQLNGVGRSRVTGGRPEDRAGLGGPKRTRGQKRSGSFGALALGVGLLLGPLLPACASGGSGSADDAEIDALAHVPDSVFVVIRNRYRLDVNVYALYLSSRRFLGIVTTNRTSEFVVPGSVAAASNFRVAADPIGSNAHYVTDQILLRKGDVVEVTIQDPLPQSYYTVH